MKTLLFITAICLFFVSISNAQQWAQTAGPGGDFLQTMTVNKHGDIFAVRAALHRSTDGGLTWKRIFPGAPINSITSLIAQPSGRLIAQVALSLDDYRFPTSGYLFFSDDNGDSWRQFPIHGFQLWQGAKNELFSVDSNMKLIRSLDDGNNWTHIDTTGVPNNLISATSDESGNLFVASTDITSYRSGFLYRSTDGGVSWSKIINGIDKLTSVIYYTKGHLFACDNGFINRGLYHSSDNGRTWAAITSDLTTGICRNEMGQIMAYGPSGWTLYQYSNAGDSIKYIKSGDWSALGNSRPTAICAEPSGIFIVGRRLGAFRFDSSDISLSTRINIPSDKVTAIIARPNNDIVAFAGGDSLFSWHSTDQGASWAQDKWANYRQYWRWITQISIDSTENIIAGYLGKVIRSSDDGMNWEVISPLLTNDAPYYYQGSFSGLLVNSAGSIFLTSLVDGLFRSTDNGSTWDQLNKGIADHSLSSLALDRSGNLYTGGKNVMYRSSDNGLNWSALTTNFPSSTKYVTAIVETIQGKLLAAIDSVGIFWSTDNGSTWSKHSSGFRATKVTSFLSTPSGKIFAATDSGVFYLDTTTGVTWTEYNLGLTAKNVLSMCIDKKGRIYIGTDVSGVFSSIETFGGSSTNDVAQSDDNSKITLGPSYPNPVSTTTTIPFTLGKRSQVLLEVTDQLGKVVARLTEKSYDSGEQQIILDAKNLGAGTYYICLQVNGKTIMTPLVKD